MPSLRRIAVGLGLGLATVLASPGAGSFAQGPLGEGPGGGLARMAGTPGGVNYIMAMLAPAVQQELKLNDDQKTKLFDLAREAQQRGRAAMQSLFRNGGNAQMLMQLGGQLRRENEAAAGKILKAEQKERLDQIMLQIEGPLAVGRREVADKLNMTAKQNQQVQVTMLQMSMSVREMVMANGGFNGLGPAGIPREAMNQLRVAATKQLGRILDAKQKFNFNKMLGEPFDLSKIDPELPKLTAAASSTTPEPEPTPPATKAEKARARRKGVAAKAAAKADDAKTDDEPKDKP